MHIYDYIVGAFQEAPFLIQISLVVVVAMIITIVILIIGLRATRSLLKIKDKEIANYKTQYEALIVDFLYSGDDSDEMSKSQRSIIIKLKSGVRIPSRQKSIITILSSLMDEVSGEMSDDIKSLYRKTGLAGHARHRLKSKKWHIVTKAIWELRQFGVYEGQEEVSKFITHHKREVRKEAQLYTVDLFKFEGLSFLDDLELPLSEWHQLQLLEALMTEGNPKICDIKPWLRSPNVSVILFAIKLAKIYNQFEVKEELISLLAHPNKEVRSAAISVLNDLFGYETEELLQLSKDAFSYEEVHVRTAEL
ncbi:HEAT repeat domain-containing protein [Bizionia paragorgiae]|uniref:HEAT repeat-containing protein n=1 Tax=Bizionia paragorgiae TaxID=283786 RepID=A0A1H3ZFH8_BIZPA|nr:HEAT repeat domain-containing protein [Bizionia paragorgiae]SEA22345.1 hypothetical protein SAMN04487990_108121 [Bizionia paragorgiae]